MIEYLQNWLRYLREEVEEPDLWAELDASRSIPQGGQEVENSPFTPGELEYVRNQLREVKQYVAATHELTSEQQRELDSRLDYLDDAAGRMGRVDWRNAVAGAFLGAVVQGMLPGDAVRDVLATLFRAVAALYGHHLPQLS